MNMPKQILLTTLMFYVFLTSGCTKNFPQPKPDIAKPKADFITEEDVGDTNTSSTQKGRGGNGNGLLSEVEDKEKTPDFFEPFLTKDGQVMMASLSKEEEARRHLPYRASDHLLDMFFEFDMYDLDEQLLAILQKNAAYLNSHPFSNIVIQGHCDERGSNNYNLSLGNQRASSVKSFLVNLGVDEKKIHTVSYGEEKPFCFENNEKCWHQNRRVRFLVAE